MVWCGRCVAAALGGPNSYPGKQELLAGVGRARGVEHITHHSSTHHHTITPHTPHTLHLHTSHTSPSHLHTLLTPCTFTPHTFSPSHLTSHLLTFTPHLTPCVQHVTLFQHRNFFCMAYSMHIYVYRCSWFLENIFSKCTLPSHTLFGQSVSVSVTRVTGGRR